jgi:hypothetical protein
MIEAAALCRMADRGQITGGILNGPLAFDKRQIIADRPKLSTARGSRCSGGDPVMLIWFVTIALLGLWGIVQHPAVLVALSPAVGLRYLFAGGGITTLLVVGGVFLCVTGGGGAVCRPGSLRPVANPAGLVLPGFPVADPELCGAGGVRAGRRTGRGEHLLPPLPRAPDAAAGATGHGCNRHRQPGGCHGRFLDDAPRNPVRLVAATEVASEFCTGR